ncbi:lysine-2,3-aminomutase-like protein [Falsirhodobacter algicola]|uniref:Lysine-2,3-aminomutase-like protein n=1 Tax=Falsirhodobacter algicola TaxID=2692330 RepID=A0A8J8MS46_9RHOB|nr:lysine-2,3-aminomutase-like protein [Falsirhodobacter algicola]QUS35720.1 lysine-2,3-aminomutase-like protein [Falsirhodobacter algicola]
MSRRASTNLDDLVREGLLPAASAELQHVAEAFRIRMTPAMHATRHPAVEAQFVPDARELVIREEELYDPIGDKAHSPVPGLTHRYPDRVILHATQTCEVYCRFCFRREAVGEDGPLPDAQMDAVIEYLGATRAIREVILTGGDPLVLSPRRLSALLRRLEAIPHLEMVRFHTRVPIVAPEKVTEALLQALDIRPAVYVVVHTNHAAELTEGAAAALRRLTRAGIPLLSQSVLLRGINDDADTLADLFRTLTRHRVTPYYLHHCDLARGTSHFRTTIAEGQALMAALRGHLSGFALPTYVLDIPGGHGKVPLHPGYAAPQGDGVWHITDWRGQVHRYVDPDRQGLDTNGEHGQNRTGT